jgi:hypothetical protein
VDGTRYERELFFGGLIKPGNSSSHRFGQFFPYSVTDVYGAPTGSALWRTFAAVSAASA